MIGFGIYQFCVIQAQLLLYAASFPLWVKQKDLVWLSVDYVWLIFEKALEQVLVTCIGDYLVNITPWFLAIFGHLFIFGIQNPALSMPW